MKAEACLAGYFRFEQVVEAVRDFAANIDDDPFEEGKAPDWDGLSLSHAADLEAAAAQIRAHFKAKAQQ